MIDEREGRPLEREPDGLSREAAAWRPKNDHTAFTTGRAPPPPLGTRDAMARSRMLLMAGVAAGLITAGAVLILLSRRS